MHVNVGSLRLDTQNKLLFGESGELLSENPRLVDTFALLVEHSPEIVSRELLLATLWPDRKVSNWALSRVIADLRSVLFRARSGDMIKTIHGKGFRLVATITVVGELPGEDLETRKNAAIDNRQSIDAVDATSVGERKKSVPQAVINLASVSLLLFGLSLLVLYFHLGADYSGQSQSFDNPADLAFLDNLESAPQVERKLIRELNLSEGWWTPHEREESIKIDKNLLHFNVEKTTGYVMTHIRGPDFLQGAMLRMTVSVDETYYSQIGMLTLAAEQGMDPFAEKLCKFENITQEPNVYECLLDKPGPIFQVPDNEVFRIGVRAGRNNDLAGVLTIHEASIQYPFQVSMNEDHWYTKPANLKREGAKYWPRTQGQFLATTLRGPINLENATLSFTFEVDDAFINSGAEIQPYAQRLQKNWSGEWSCWVHNEDLVIGGMTQSCVLASDIETFILGENDYMQIGVIAKGEKIAGTIKIIGISIGCENVFNGCVSP